MTAKDILELLHLKKERCDNNISESFDKKDFRYCDILMSQKYMIELIISEIEPFVFTSCEDCKYHDDPIEGVAGHLFCESCTKICKNFSNFERKLR